MSNGDFARVWIESGRAVTTEWSITEDRYKNKLLKLTYSSNPDREEKVIHFGFTNNKDLDNFITGLEELRK